jgi:hypothetical protein
MTKPESQIEPAAGLVGRFFHIFGADRSVARQGRVIAQIDPTHYLVHSMILLSGKRAHWASTRSTL